MNARREIKASKDNKEFKQGLEASSYTYFGFSPPRFKAQLSTLMQKLQQNSFWKKRHKIFLNHCKANG